MPIWRSWPTFSWWTSQRSLSDWMPQFSGSIFLMKNNSCSQAVLIDIVSMHFELFLAELMLKQIVTAHRSKSWWPWRSLLRCRRWGESGWGSGQVTNNQALYLGFEKCCLGCLWLPFRSWMFISGSYGFIWKQGSLNSTGVQSFLTVLNDHDFGVDSYFLYQIRYSVNLVLVCIFCTKSRLWLMKLHFSILISPILAHQTTILPSFGALSLVQRWSHVPQERHVRATTDFLVAKNVEIENAVNDAWP